MTEEKDSFKFCQQCGLAIIEPSYPWVTEFDIRHDCKQIQIDKLKERLDILENWTGWNDS